MLGSGCFVIGNSMKRIRVGSFGLSASVSIFLSCDCPGGLCRFVWPICHLIPCTFIRLGASCHTMRGFLMKRVRVGSFHLRAPDEKHSGWVILFKADCIKFAKL